MTTVGLGCSAQHLPLLRAVDIPIVVRNDSSRQSDGLLAALPDALLTTLDGSAAWVTVVLNVIQQCQRFALIAQS